MSGSTMNSGSCSRLRITPSAAAMRAGAPRAVRRAAMSARSFARMSAMAWSCGLCMPAKLSGLRCALKRCNCELLLHGPLESMGRLPRNGSGGCGSAAPCPKPKQLCFIHAQRLNQERPLQCRCTPSDPDPEDQVGELSGPTGFPLAADLHTGPGLPARGRTLGTRQLLKMHCRAPQGTLALFYGGAERAFKLAPQHADAVAQIARLFIMALAQLQQLVRDGERREHRDAVVTDAARGAAQIMHLPVQIAGRGQQALAFLRRAADQELAIEQAHGHGDGFAHAISPNSRVPSGARSSPRPASAPVRCATSVAHARRRAARGCGAGWRFPRRGGAAFRWRGPSLRTTRPARPSDRIRPWAPTIREFPVAGT